MGVLYAKVDGIWEPIVTAVGVGGGMEWPIQTRNPPLIIGEDMNAQQSACCPDAFVQIDKYEELAGEDYVYDPSGTTDPVASASGKYWRPRYVQWHPLSEYGPFWTFNSPSGVGAPPPYLRDVNPDHDFAGISSDWTGQFFISPAEAIWYSTTPGKQQLTKPPGGYVPYDQSWQYNMDVHWHFDHMYFGFGSLEIEHWEDILRGYPIDGGVMPDDQVWDVNVADIWLGSGAYFEMFTDSFGDHQRNDVEVMSAIWGSAWSGDKLHDPGRPEVVIWARYEEGRDPPYYVDHGDGPFPYYEREVHFTSHNMHLYVEVPNRTYVGLPDGALNRGGIPVLAAAHGVMGTKRSPQFKQWYRQIGQQNVTFTDGIGSITIPEEIVFGTPEGEFGETANWHPQAVIIDNEVGGPMIAQVMGYGGGSGLGSAHLGFYLDRDFDGVLAVSWSVDYEEPQWSTTRPVVGYIYVYGEVPTSGLRPNTAYFLHDGASILIPWAESGTVDLRLYGQEYATPPATIAVVDFNGDAVGTITAWTWGDSGQNYLDWTIPRDLYDVGDGTTFHVVNSDGQFSNWFRLEWADIPLPTTTP